MQPYVRVRFAPSPTGWLHIGGARTALFNFLYARHYGGQFLLRIEDTDRERSDTEMTRGILDSLRWLGLQWDEEIVFQAAGLDRHKAVARELLENDKAYRCFCTAESLNAKRETAEKGGGGYVYDGTCRHLSKESVEKNLGANQSFTVRFKIPPGETVFDDAVRGTVAVLNQELDDFIILRSDGTPVYQVAVVVDDHDMGITHVIRGDDHLSNTPKQIQIYRALGWETPSFAHVPMILGPDKKRLSKRHGATAVGDYRDAGYLAEALVNYLALLSWSPGDGRELLSLQELMDAFTLERVSKNASVFDETKLEWMNAQYIHAMHHEDLTEALMPLIESKGLLSRPVTGKEKQDLCAIVSLLKERIRRLTDFPDQAIYFFLDPEQYDENAVSKHWLKEEVHSRLLAVINAFDAVGTWSEDSLESVVRQLAETLGIGAGKLIHPIRLAVTGQGNSPGLFEVLVVLGKERVMRRLLRAVQWIQTRVQDI